MAFRLYYPAKSEERLTVICEKLAIVFGLPPFQTTFRSEYFEKAESGREDFMIEVVEYFGSISEEQVEQMRGPNYWDVNWDLRWRIGAGLQFNYQVVIHRGLVTRNQRHKTARKLRSVFTVIKLHGEKWR